jgi:DNA-binding beta-propeller fold protein YncE
LRGLSGTVSDAPVISRPTAIASRKGRIYVAEPSVKAIMVFDVPRQKIFRFGQRDPNLLKRPQALAVDDKDRIHVLDTQLRKVMVFDDMGLFLHALPIAAKVASPAGIAVSGDGETIYLVDRGSVEGDDHRVVALARDGKERFELGPRGSEPGQFNIPLAAATAPDGTLYVVDSGNFRVQAFTPDGRFKFQFGGIGTGIGNFARPRAIAVDKEGKIFVGDSGFNNVQIFDSSGALLMPLGRLGRDPGARAISRCWPASPWTKPGVCMCSITISARSRSFAHSPTTKEGPGRAPCDADAELAKRHPALARRG